MKLNKVKKRKKRKKSCESPTLIPDEFENVKITLQKFLQITSERSMVQISNFIMTDTIVTLYI